VGTKKDRKAPEIEVTEEMIAAGVAAYAKWKPDDFSWVETEAELVRTVFVEMCAARGRD
jgi:hypothetical protein